MDDVLADQIAYYRARAPEYDRWWQRSWAHDRGGEVAAVWERDVDVVTTALDEFGPTGKVLELACGTGWWTERLAAHASELIAVDASPEAIELARARAPRARYIVADLFSWTPDDTFDVVFFSFWLSHVPADRFDWFWSVVDRALVPGGRVFFVDNLGSPITEVEGLAAVLQRDESPDGVVTRKLYDGTEFRAVKVYYEPPELKERLRALGWDAMVRGTEAFFYYGCASRG